MKPIIYGNEFIYLTCEAFSKGADVLSHVEMVKDLTLRAELDPSSTLPSICFYTFFNTYDSLNCLSISEDTTLIAGGFSDSYVKIYSLKREKLRGLRGLINPAEMKTGNIHILDRIHID